MEDDNELDDLYGSTKEPEGQVHEDPDKSNNPDDQNKGTIETEPVVGDGNDDGVKENKNNIIPDNVNIDENASALDLILSEYNIVGGNISLEDGSTLNINELAPSKQLEVINQLRQTELESARQEIIDSYGLSDEETNILNLGRENEGGIEAYIQKIAQERAENILSQRASVSDDYDNMEDKAVYMKYLRDTNPDASAEDLETALEEAVSFKGFSNMIKPIRDNYKRQVESERKEQEAQEKAQELAALEEDRKTIVQNTQDIDELYGVALSREDKLNVYKDILEVNDQGDSLFIEKMLSDPKKLFKVAWLVENGDKLSETKDNYWKKKVTAAYNEGKNEVLNGMPSGRTTGIKPKNINKKESTKDFENELDSLY